MLPQHRAPDGVTAAARWRLCTIGRRRCSPIPLVAPVRLADIGVLDGLGWLAARAGEISDGVVRRRGTGRRYGGGLIGLRPRRAVIGRLRRRYSRGVRSAALRVHTIMLHTCLGRTPANLFAVARGMAMIAIGLDAKCLTASSCFALFAWHLRRRVLFLPLRRAGLATDCAGVLPGAISGGDDDGTKLVLL